MTTVHTDLLCRICGTENALHCAHSWNIIPPVTFDPEHVAGRRKLRAQFPRRWSEYGLSISVHYYDSGPILIAVLINRDTYQAAALHVNSWRHVLDLLTTISDCELDAVRVNDYTTGQKATSCLRLNLEV